MKKRIAFLILIPILFSSCAPRGPIGQLIYGTSFSIDTLKVTIGSNFLLPQEFIANRQETGNHTIKYLYVQKFADQNYNKELHGYDISLTPDDPSTTSYSWIVAEGVNEDEIGTNKPYYDFGQESQRCMNEGSFTVNGKEVVWREYVYEQPNRPMDYYDKPPRALDTFWASVSHNKIRYSLIIKLYSMHIFTRYPAPLSVYDEQSEMCLSMAEKYFQSPFDQELSSSGI